MHGPRTHASVGPVVFVPRSEPGCDDYTPAYEVHRVAWEAEPRTLRSAADVEAAAEAGELALEALEVAFKLHECFPGSRYIVTDTSAPPMAEGMQIGGAPRLADATAADGTGGVNVLMGGPEGPGPMGGQPSVSDSRAGDPVWSPYWDHLTYAWNEDADARVLPDEDQLHEARDAGELEEFVGTPVSGGQGFVVNCPVPVVAPNTFRA